MLRPVSIILSSVCLSDAQVPGALLGVSSNVELLCHELCQTNLGVNYYDAPFDVAPLAAFGCGLSLASGLAVFLQIKLQLQISVCSCCICASPASISIADLAGQAYRPSCS